MSRAGAAWLGRHWSLASFWGLRVFAGTRFEVRGTVPPKGVLVAVKHMSMWDTMAIYCTARRSGDRAQAQACCAFRSMAGTCARRGMIPIDRDGKASALRAMAAAARAEIEQRTLHRDLSRRHAQKTRRAARLQTRRGGSVRPTRCALLSRGAELGLVLDGAGGLSEKEGHDRDRVPRANPAGTAASRIHGEA